MQSSYNLGLVALSVIVAVLSSYVALDLNFSLSQSKGYIKFIWLTCGSAAMGFGIWSMHFIGMLAFDMPGMQMSYDLPLMALSLFFALAASWLALYIMSRPRSSRTSLLLSALAMAAAILGMHYIGMASMRMPAHIEWNLALVALSAVIAGVASYASFAVAEQVRARPDRIWFLISASIVMGIAISAMHYTGMAAATFIHDEDLKTGSLNLEVTDTSSLTVITIAAAIVVLLIALASTFWQRVLTARTRQNEIMLGNSERKYRRLVEAVKDYAIFMLDTQGRITTWNAGAERITGYRESEIIGKHVSTLYPKSGRTDEAEFEMRTACETGHFEGEALRVRHDGTSFWANIMLDPLYDGHSRLSGFSKVVRDVTQLKVGEERIRSVNEELESRVRERTIALQSREAQLNTITNALPVLVAQFDRHERVLFANNSFCRNFGVEPDKVRGLHFRDLLMHTYAPNKIFVDQALAGQTVTYERPSYSDAKGTILEVTLVPEFDLSERVTGFIAVASDVTRHKEIEAQLKAAKEEAEVANQTKSAFLANMSHEIRTPLGAVIGFSELMLDSQLSPSERMNGIEIIKRNGRLLSTIINDILDLSKVEAGKVEFEKHDTPVHELLGEIAALLELEASAKGVRFSISLEGIVPQTITTDPTRLRQILFNVVGNAIKFTEKGTVLLKVKLDPKSPENIAFVVKDTGAGISPEQAQRLFSPFTQADPTTTRRFGGSGLGLVLARKLARGLGGDVELAESALGMGSTFVVTVKHGQSSEVPFAHAAHLQAAPLVDVMPLAPVPQLAHRRVLVVDDSTDNLALVRKILTLVGCEVETASNGRDAVAKAMDRKFSLILMDLQMPEMDGFQATRELRRRGYKGPIIALTAHAMKEERKRCLENGFNDHLTKPIDRMTLIQTLAGYPA